MLWLSDLARDPSRDPGAFGGKAEGLARLIATGARVPRGFVVRPTTRGPDDWSDRDREAFLSFGRELLSSEPVAVRSSARGEDSVDRSYAGLFETVLGVKTERELLAAAATCVASGASERVTSYSGSGERIPVGLVVQSLVDARAAGVCFTVDPTGRDGAVVIEAVPGLGDALVSGRVQPEAWRVYRSGLGELEARGPGRALRPGEAVSIATEATDLAARLGKPLDLEWAIDREGALWWLQARPITALVAAPSPWIVQRGCEEADDGPVTVWLNWNVKETLPQPLPPLSWDFWRERVLPILNLQLFGIRPDSPLSKRLSGLDLVHGRMYVNLNALVGFPIAGGLMRRLLKTVDSRGGEELDHLFESGVLAPRRFVGSKLGFSLRMLAASLTSLIRLGKGLFPRRALATLHATGTAIHRRPAPSTLSDGELLAEMDLWARPEGRPLLDGLQMEGVAMLVYGVASVAFRGHEKALSLLATGISANPTTQISLGIEDLAEHARPLAPAFLEPITVRELLARLRDEPAATAWLARFAAFLDTNGHRGPMEFDIASTRWSEDPTMIVELVRARLRSLSGERLADRLSRLAAERREALETAVSGSPLWRRPVLRALARLVELYMPLREAPKHYGIFVFARVRKAVLELGRRLVERGVLPHAEDVFFLSHAELEGLFRPASTSGAAVFEASSLASRRERHARFEAEKPPDLLRSDGVPAQEPEPPPGDGVLRGTPVSAGRATGPVKVLLTPDATAIADGDVLVMELADPGWTPLFPRASAVVMEIGGLMCHAAVVAREMGIPAVFAVKGATRLLVTGQRVTVDGTAGTIERAEP